MNDELVSGMIGAVSGILGACIGGIIAGREQRKTELYKLRRQAFEELLHDFVQYHDELNEFGAHAYGFSRKYRRGEVTEADWEKDVEDFESRLIPYYEKLLSTIRRNTNRGYISKEHVIHEAASEMNYFYKYYLKGSYKIYWNDINEYNEYFDDQMEHLHNLIKEAEACLVRDIRDLEHQYNPTIRSYFDRLKVQWRRMKQVIKHKVKHFIDQHRKQPIRTPDEVETMLKSAKVNLQLSGMYLSAEEEELLRKVFLGEISEKEFSRRVKKRVR